jgi:2-C-methyl-D-erythritol 2,4-cyclodiphosphate synthase
MLEERGFEIANIDATILAERPKMAPHISEMKSKLAEAMGVDTSQINIKAKTNEGLDAIGCGDAIGAQAVALIEAADSTPANLSSKKLSLDEDLEMIENMIAEFDDKR